MDTGSIDRGCRPGDRSSSWTKGTRRDSLDRYSDSRHRDSERFEKRKVSQEAASLISTKDAITLLRKRITTWVVDHIYGQVYQSTTTSCNRWLQRFVNSSKLYRKCRMKG